MMPVKMYYRQWCKSCNDFTFHTSEPGSELTCRICDTEFSSIMIQDIPENKVEEQRTRFKEHRRRTMFSYLRNPLEMIKNSEMFGNDDFIIETDVGLLAIEERIRQERESIRRSNLELKQKFANLGRNELCRCGSGKKYKKCCQPKINKL